MRDIDEDAGIGRLYLPREALAAAGVTTDEPLAAAADPKLAEPASKWRRGLASISTRLSRSWRGAASGGEAPRLMAVAYGSILDRMVNEGFAPPRRRARRAGCGCLARCCATASYERRRGPCHRRGDRGLERGGATGRCRPQGHRARGRVVRGGRCRSYLDPALGLVIDNGNHLLLSGNHAALDYLDRIGARGTLHDPGAAIFDFADLKTGERWRLDLSEGRIPWWLFDRKKRVPGTALGEYFAPLGVFMKGRSATVGEAMACEGPLYERLWRPLLTSALNTEPRESSAALAAALLRETLAAGGKACHPLFAGPWPCEAASSIRRWPFSPPEAVRFGSANAFGRSVSR